mgnify:FL=1
MINAYFGIKNPFWRKGDNDRYRMFWQFTRDTKWKEFEINFHRHVWYYFEISLNTMWYGEDHAGVEFTIGLFGYILQFTMSDKRHWDDEAGTWESWEYYTQEDLNEAEKRGKELASKLKVE